MIIQQESESNSESANSNSAESESLLEGSVTTVSQNSLVVMVIECKKTVSAALIMLESNDVIELFIYCRYILDIKQQSSVIGILTDGINWHCFYLKRDKILMDIFKYVSFQSKEEDKIIVSLPKLVSLLTV